MPQLAVSDTPLSRRLVQEDRLEVDRFETSGPLTEGAVAALDATQVPLLLHNGVWDWSLGNPGALLESDVLRQTHQRLTLTGAPWLSVHLGYSAVRVEFKKGIGFCPAPDTAKDDMHPGSVQPASEDLFTVISQNVRTLKEAVNVPLLIENLDYTPTGAYEHVCETEFITEVLAATEVELLLDLAHAQVSASRLGYGIQAYLAKLPLERVKQLHISAPRSDGNALVDAHEPLREEDYELLEDVLGRTEPWAVTLEYGKDEGALLEQIARLQQLLKA